jgi:hypothetical protein
MVYDAAEGQWVLHVSSPSSIFFPSQHHLNLAACIASTSPARTPRA